MTDPDAHVAAHRPALGWALIVIGLVICAIATWLAPDLIDGLGLTSELTILVLFYGAIFLPMVVVAIAFARTERFSAVRLGAEPGRWIGIGLASGLGGLSVAAAYAVLARSIAPGSAEFGGYAMLILGLGIILFQTASEEVLFRGWLQPSLSAKMGSAAAIGVSALLFSAFHILGGARAPLSLLNLLLGGLWFGLLAWRSGGLVAPLAAHFAWNAAEELGLGLSPNPGTGSFGALWDWDLVQAPLWGGSGEGLNNSVGMTVVLMALIVPLIWRSAGPTRASVTAPVAPGRDRPGHAAV